MQPVYRKEIIVLDKRKKKSIAIDPETGQPYFFWFVDNTSSSEGTFESPFSDFQSAEQASQPRDIIYVFSGDGTDQGMNQGLHLKDDQKLLGAGTSHPFNTSAGEVYTPILSKMPLVTNRNVPGLGGNAVDAANRNEIAGFIMYDLKMLQSSAIGSQLDITSGCKIRDNIFASYRDCIIFTHPIGVDGGTMGTIEITNNQFIGLDASFNIRGVVLSLLEGNVSIANNLFTGTFPQGGLTDAVILEKAFSDQTSYVYMKNNVFDSPANDNVTPTAIHIDNQSPGNLHILLKNNHITMPEGHMNEAGIEIISDLPLAGLPGITFATLLGNVSLVPPPAFGYVFKNETGDPNTLQIHFAPDNIGTRNGP